MNVDPRPTECQIFCLPHMAQQIGVIDNLQYLFRRAKRFLKRRMTYLKNRLAVGVFRQDNADSMGARQISETIHLRAGDLVRIKSKDAIQSTLNDWNSLRGCTFLEEMWAYCGTTQHVLKKVEKFLDERDYHIKKTNGIVTLEGLICNGTADFGRCDRSCFFFWREEWLEKLDRKL
jgi:hypothetical protein